jgi:Spy/CpxP family protein refolding chaperone
MEEKREAEMEPMHERMEQKRKEIDDKISSILTTEQKKKFEEMKKERQERFDRP